MLSKVIDEDKPIQLVESPYIEGHGVIVMTMRNGERNWKGVTREEALELAKELEAYALGE